MAEVGGCVRRFQFAKGLGHCVKLQRFQLIQGWMIEHQCLLENSILLAKARDLFLDIIVRASHQIIVPVLLNPLVQRRQANTQVRFNLPARQSTGQCKANRLTPELFAASRYQVRPP